MDCLQSLYAYCKVIAIINMMYVCFYVFVYMISLCCFFGCFLDDTMVIVKQLAFTYMCVLIFACIAEYPDRLET